VRTQRAIRELDQGTKTLRAHASNLPVAWAWRERRTGPGGFGRDFKDPQAYAYDPARIHAVLGEDEEAIIWLERSVAPIHRAFFPSIRISGLCTAILDFGRWSTAWVFAWWGRGGLA